MSPTSNREPQGCAYQSPIRKPAQALCRTVLAMRESKRSTIHKKLQRAAGGSSGLILLALAGRNVAGNQQILLILDVAFGQDRQQAQIFMGANVERRQSRLRHAMTIKRNIAIGIDQLLAKAAHLQLAQIVGMQILVPLKLPHSSWRRWGD